MYIAILFVSLFLPSTVLVGVFMHTQTHSLFLSSANRTNVGHVTSHHDGPCLVQRSFSWSFSTPKSIKLHKFCFAANYGGSEAAKEKKTYFNCSTSTFKIISTLFISDSQKNSNTKKMVISTWPIFLAGGKFAITRAFRNQGASYLLSLGGSTTCLLGQIAFKLSYFSVLLTTL